MNNPKAYRIFLISRIVGSFLFTLVYTIQAVYYVQNAGMNPLQLVLVGTVLEGTIFLFEVPTGMVADTYSRRLSIIIGLFLWGAAFLIEGSFPNVAAILFAQVVMGLGWTFNSGALEAWIADEVGEEQIGPLFLRASQVGRLAQLSAIVASVGIASIQLNVPILLGGVGFLALAIYMVFSMPETGFRPMHREEREGFGAMKATFQAGTRVMRASPLLITFVVLSVFVGASSEGMDRLSEAHFLKSFTFPELGRLQPVVWFGIIDIGLIFLGLLSTRVIQKRVDTNNHVQVARVLFVFNVLQILGILGFALAGSFGFALVAYWGMRLFRNIASPLYSTWLVQSIDSRVRATVLSMTNQADAIGQVAGGPGIGWIGTVISIRAALVMSALLLTPVLPLVARAGRQVDGNVAEAVPEVAAATSD